MSSPTIVETRVQPGARQTRIDGFIDGISRLRVTAKPERGQANEAAIALLADTLEIAKSRVVLLRGAGSRNKIFAIQGMSREAFEALLRLRTEGRETSP